MGDPRRVHVCLNDVQESVICKADLVNNDGGVHLYFDDDVAAVRRNNTGLFQDVKQVAANQDLVVCHAHQYTGALHAA